MSDSDGRRSSQSQADGGGAPEEDGVLELDASFLGDAAILYGDDEDEEPEEEELSEEDPELQGEPVFAGPATWDQVDPLELEQIMLRVTAAAIPSTDGKDVGSRLALQAAALESDNADPLGLGRIDPRQLQLIRLDEAKKAWKGRNVGLSKRRGVRRSDTDAAAEAADSRQTGLVTEANIQELRPKALPSSDSFDPDVYLGTIHAATRLGDLVKGRQNLTVEVSERTGQLKALVKENFDRFISCKNTIDDIHKRLRKSEAHDAPAGSGASTSEMVIALSEVQDEARRAFATLLERAASSEQVKSVVALLKRYEGLFQLPSRIRVATERGDFDQVINEYKKAKALMEGIAVPNTKTVWHKLFTEVEKGVGEMVRLRLARLADAHTSQLEAIDAMRQVFLLQAEGSASSRGVDPALTYVRARELEVKAQLEGCAVRHRAALKSAREQEADARAAWAGSAPASESLAASPFSEGVPAEARAWAAHVQELAGAVGAIADFWHVAAEDKLDQLRAVPGALDTLLAATAESERIGKELLTTFAGMLQPALSALVQLEQAPALFQGAVRAIVAVFLTFKARRGPPFVAVCLQDLLEGACGLVIEQMQARLKRLMQRMVDHEDFVTIAASHKAGFVCSKVPGMLRSTLSACMQQLEQVVLEGSRAYSEADAMDPLGSHGTRLRTAFFDAFTQYGVATDQLWAAVCSKSGAAGRAAVSRDTKLLVLHSNCVAVRGQVLRELASRYASLLHADGGFQEARELQAECGEDVGAVEARLAGIYIQSRVELLNDVLEEYFEDDGTVWTEAPMPAGPRDCAFEIVNALVAVQAEVYTNALSLQKRVMDELLQHLFSAYNTYLSEHVGELNPGGALQMLIELQYFAQALGPTLRPPRDALVGQARAALLARVNALAAVDGSPTEEELDGWCETIQGGEMGGRAEMVCNFVVADLLKATRLNVASFKGQA